MEANGVENKIVHLLTGKPSLREVTVEELQAITQEMPFFAVAQLMLVQKMKQEEHPAFHQQVRKTSLYFPNPFWLQYQLQGKPGHIRPESVSAPPPQPAPQTEPAAQTEPAPPPEPAVQPEQAPEPAPAPIVIDEPATFEEPVVEHQAVAEEEPVVNDQPAPEELAPAEEVPLQPVAEETISDTVPEPAPAEPEEEISDEAGPVVDEEPRNMRLAEMIQQQAEAFNKEETRDTPLIEPASPYHTVDYFASQGIRLAEGQDRLGDKVRKFTDWLKQMKRVTPDPQDLGTDAELENAVQVIAASSLESRDVVTETMGEVLIKQGRLDKAIKLYTKLSFLNPDKSAYFAAKISELKRKLS